jgi:uncharacterized membrane protein YdfJ with MMPL/SSD domain
MQLSPLTSSRNLPARMGRWSASHRRIAIFGWLAFVIAAIAIGTAGTVTSAAVVMVGAFSIFATMPILDMKEFGVGLATAVLIDATIVRGVLLPASMRLLGDRNWYLPNWLGWLPKLEHHIEPRVEPVPAAA